MSGFVGLLRRKGNERMNQEKERTEEQEGKHNQQQADEEEREGRTTTTGQAFISSTSFFGSWLGENCWASERAG